MNVVSAALSVIMVSCLSLSSVFNCSAQAQETELMILAASDGHPALENSASVQGTAATLDARNSKETVSQDKPEFCVNGIIYDPQSPSAIVNGTMVRVGNAVGEARVQSISDSEVVFQYHGSFFSRTIGQGCARVVAAAKPKPVASAVSRRSKPTAFRYRLGGPRGSLSKADIRRQAEAFIRSMWVFVLFFIVGTYIYTAIVLQVLARKTGTEGGWLAWVPIANLFLQCSIAGKSCLWILVIFVPFVGPMIFIISMWVGIAQARGKPGWLGFLMLIPVVSYILPGYLAFSKDAVIPKETKEPPPDPLAHIGQMK
ncbi:MAG: DUF5684 domain-containing protein [Candidatus Omnitrophota bacterium]